MSAVLATLNSIVRELLRLSDEAKLGRASKRDLLRLLDELDAHLDTMIQTLIPEKITDERFKMVLKVLDNINEQAMEVRKLAEEGRFTRFKKALLEMHTRIRHLYRMLMIIRAGAPAPMIFQFVPLTRSIELRASEPLLFSNPMALQVYNALVRRGEAAIDELARELNVTDANRDDFNRAVVQLINLGYVEPWITAEGRLVLKARR